MTITTFNPITYANKLKKAGMETKIADVHAEELVNMINQDLATKSDLRVMETELKGFVVKSLIALAGFILTTETLVGYLTK